VKKAGRFLVIALCVLILSCDLDGWGWLISSDVDDRYADNQALLEPADLALAPPYSFVVIADTHILGNNKVARFTAFRTNQLIPTDRFILACGDLVQNGSYADFVTFADEAAALLPIRVYSIPGNHDLYHDGWLNYRDVLGRSMYSFSTDVTAGPGSLRVIAIDSANGTLGAPQRAWLEGVLASRTEQLCVTFTHFQFFNDSIIQAQQWTDVTEAYSLMHLFETRGVNIHFAGHTHAYLARTINGTDYVTLPAFSGGAVRVTVDNSGVMSWELFDF
jgi:3',5'-cyclic AMP phosphodiesterase CpdA